MYFKLILTAITALMLLLSGCEKAKEVTDASKEAADKMATTAAEKTGDVTKAAAKKMDDVVETVVTEMTEATQETFDATLSAAKTLSSKAADLGVEWRDTGKLLKTAEKTASEGDFAKAIELANTAKMQAEVAIQQNEGMKNAAPRF